MNSRNPGVKVACVLVMLVAGLLGTNGRAYAQASPGMAHWVDPLPVPPVAVQTYKPSISSWADYYEIDMRASQHQFNSALGPATVWTYRPAREGSGPARPDDRGDERPARGRQVHQ